MGHSASRNANNGIDRAFASAYSAGSDFARAVGVVQSATGHTAKNYVSNDGFIGASARAYDAESGDAFAYAAGVHQDAGTGIAHVAHFANNTVDNTGTIVALAKASSGVKPAFT